MLSPDFRRRYSADDHGFVCKYEYPDERGRVLLWKNRYEPKSFAMFARSPRHPRDGVPLTPSAIERKYPGARRYFNGLLYGLPLLLADPPRVVLTEGEKDSDAFNYVGVPALSHWGGALRFHPEQAEHFRGYTGQIILCCDRDDDRVSPAFGKGYADAVRRYDALIAVGIRSGQLVAALPKLGKDAADALARLPLHQSFREISVDELRQRAAMYTPPPGEGDGGGFDYDRDVKARLQELGLSPAAAHWDYGIPYATQADEVAARRARKPNTLAVDWQSAGIAHAKGGEFG